MDKFSDRFGYTIPNQEPIIEDAPMWLRTVFQDYVIDNYLENEHDLLDDYMDYAGQEEYSYTEFDDLLSVLCRKLRCDFRGMIASQFQEYDLLDKSKWKTYFDTIMRNISWYQFYDLVEIIGELYIQKHDEYADLAGEDGDAMGYDTMKVEWYDKIGQYIEDINRIFEENNVRWRLDKNCKLQLLIPDELIGGRTKVVQQLRDNGYKTTLTHFKKAEQFITRRPLDSSNAVKEISSAMEALGTKLFPEVQGLTVTKMVGAMDGSPKYPKQLKKIMREFYDYACSEPGVRHGIEDDIRVRFADAEFCFHMGAAILQYMMSVNDQPAEKS